MSISMDTAKQGRAVGRSSAIDIQTSPTPLFLLLSRLVSLFHSVIYLVLCYFLLPDRHPFIKHNLIMSSAVDIASSFIEGAPPGEVSCSLWFRVIRYTMNTLLILTSWPTLFLVIPRPMNFWPIH